MMVDIVEDPRQVSQLRTDFMSKLFTHPHTFHLRNHCSDCRLLSAGREKEVVALIS